MSGGAITLLVVAICLVPLAGLFGAMDAALQRVSKARVEELRREGVKRAPRARGGRSPSAPGTWRCCCCCGSSARCWPRCW